MSPTRRSFLEQSLSCAGYLAVGLSLAPATVRRSFAATAKRPVVAEADYARIERIADGVWAVISTPFKDGGRHFATLSNGGIVAGKHGVLVVEAFFMPDGAAWLAAQARKLTGMDPTHVVVTHYHADHCRGLLGFERDRDAQAAQLQALATPTTRQLMEDEDFQREGEEERLPSAGVPETDEPLEIDLGKRTVRIVPRRGHTASDVSIEVEKPRVTFCGDLVWNGMFPNYVDALPSALTEHAGQILARPKTTFVPGHGDIPDAKQVASFLGLLQDVEAAARKAFELGKPAAEAAEAYEVPESLGEWQLFSPAFPGRAFAAWERELQGDG